MTKITVFNPHIYEGFKIESAKPHLRILKEVESRKMLK